MNIQILLEIAQKNEKAMQHLKDCAVHCQQFAIAAELREMQKNIPEKIAQAKGIELDLALRMAGINAGARIAWLGHSVFSEVAVKGGSFTLKDASELEALSLEYFKNK